MPSVFYLMVLERKNTKLLWLPSGASQIAMHRGTARRGRVMVYKSVSPGADRILYCNLFLPALLRFVLVGTREVDPADRVWNLVKPCDHCWLR